MAKYTIIMVCYGKPDEDRKNSLSGWSDINLTAKDVQDATNIGKALREFGISLDLAFTSASSRAQKTLNIILKELSQRSNIPRIKSWHLNTLPFWEDVVVPEVKAGKSIILVADGSTLHTIIKYLDQLTMEQVRNLHIPPGVPLVYTLDENLQPIGKLRFLEESEEEEIQKLGTVDAHYGFEICQE